MRTATTIAKTHAGDWKLVHSPAVPIHEQKTALNKLRASRTHAEYSEVCWQESDGVQVVARFTKPIETTETFVKRKNK